MADGEALDWRLTVAFSKRLLTFVKRCWIQATLDYSSTFAGNKFWCASYDAHWPFSHSGELGHERIAFRSNQLRLFCLFLSDGDGCLAGNISRPEFNDSSVVIFAFCKEFMPDAYTLMPGVSEPKPSRFIFGHWKSYQSTEPKGDWNDMLQSTRLCPNLQSPPRPSDNKPSR